MVLRGIWVCLLVLLLWCEEAKSLTLDQRLASFPHWDSLSLQLTQPDLIYPEWMSGTWNVTSTLVEQFAPLAPDIVSPGFEGNRRYLNVPVKFLVRFGKNRLPMSSSKFIPQPLKVQSAIVADRAFNGLNLAKAMLGDRVIALKVDPDSQDRQITFLQGDRQLISIVTGRATQTLDRNDFITCEVFRQQFRGNGARPFFNQVESTTAYHYQQSIRAVEADQVTAVYLSPQDPDYFSAGSRPVALYRYHLKFFPTQELQ